MRKRFFLILLGLGMLSASAPAFSQKAASQKNKAAAPSAAPAEQKAPVAATEDPNYIIGEEDALVIKVWKEPDLTGPAVVRPDGKVTLALINDVQAAGLTPIQLAKSISEKLKQFIADPQVSVIVTAINSRKIYIMGEVGRAGVYPLLTNMTVLQALASSGSFTQFANPKKIYVMRNEGGKQVKYPFNYNEVIKGNHLEQNIMLKPGDTIVVP